jgi:hypothetical protein
MGRWVEILTGGIVRGYESFAWLVSCQKSNVLREAIYEYPAHFLTAFELVQC